nr:putative ribonuclease H-like domain-containing protein [Tanacetum cinerariifolium]
ETQAVLPSSSPLLRFEEEIKAIFWEFGFDFFSVVTYMKPTHRSVGHRPHGAPIRPPHRSAGHRPHGPSMNPMRPNMNVKTQYRAPWVPTVNRNNPLVNRKFSTGRRNFPTANRKFPTASRKFPTGSTKIYTADMGRKGKAVKPSACWIWKPTKNLSNKECIVLGRDFKLLDDANILLRTPRQHNMYSIDLNNIVPHKDLTCLVAKASADECILWHRRLGYLNVKTMNILVRHNLVRGLPTKSFDNDHTCTACLKGKQHKASCKSKLVNSVTKPLHTLHMDLFGPTSVSSISHKWYCLVVTDDFSRFTWTFFLRSKDETSNIL